MSNISKNNKYVHHMFIIVIFLYCVPTNSALSVITDDLAFEETPMEGVRIYPTSQRFKRDTELTCDSKKPSKQCAPDCKTLLFCDGGKLNGKVVCPSAKPDCDSNSNTCVASRPGFQCIPQQKDPDCAGNEGYFPDPLNCRKFSYCEDGQVIQNYTCPPNYAADIDSQHCIMGGRCGTINCFGKTVAIHPTYQHIYALCKNNVIIPGTYSACPKATEEYNPKDLDCKTKCRMEGYLPHITECNLFYRCLASGPGGALEMTLQSCPRNQNYNQIKQKCEKNIECQ